MTKHFRFPLFIALIALLVPLLVSLLSSCGGDPYASARPVTFQADRADVAEADGMEVSVGENGAVVVTITAGGAYRLSGTCASGSVVVDCAEDVTLVLEDLTLTNPAGSCIASIGEGNLVLYVRAGTESTLTDGAGYVFPNAMTDEPDAVVFAKNDLTLSGAGDGICHLVAYYKTGAAAKDVLTVTGGNYTISSVRHGIRGRDGVSVTGGLLAIDAAADGIRTTNDNPGKEGTVTVSGGVVQIMAGDEGIQSVSDVTVTGGEVTIDSTNNGIKSASGTLRVTGGLLSVTAADEAVIAVDVSHTGGAFTVDGIAWGEDEDAS